jgi:16S rRNA (cytidine1402-2'-O)-methyltransferase
MNSAIKMAVIYIVGTPIGNLEDISQRALRILSEVDLILCEDTRVTKKLLERYCLKTPTLSYHQHSKIQKTDYIVGLLKQGKNLALLSDAGTPGISDPGNKLIEKIVESLGDSVKISSVPGPSALAAAASVSGLPTDKFLFMGFPPVRKKRRKFFEEIERSDHPVIFYESTYRILRTLEELASSVGNRKIAVCRELTKKFETIYRGEINEIIRRLIENKEEIKGEFVVVVGSRLKNKQ